ncbi:universal stress protein [Malikia sp.]|uniref:universal stress protein n=1 Tax=Malikia sp. TaxID=2070706 RepID=UPI002627F3D0|nr:universal stress protein [Malikia sp.]MDD2729082.1 universal stress protein [Malikia sp.]
MYQHLFVPVDGSELSHRAMEGSIALAKQLGARITGFVVEPEMALSETSHNAQLFAQHMQQHEASNEAHAAKLLARFEQQASQAGVPFQGVHRTAGGIDNAIIDEADKAGCDMIVMVTHGRGPVGEFLFGSHTKKVIARSKLPVFVLH